MAIDITPDVRTWLKAFPTVIDKLEGVVCQNTVPDNKPRGYVWYRLASEQHDACLDDAPGSNAMANDFDVEICTYSLDDAVNIATEIKNATPFRGAIGGYSSKLVTVNNHDESYQLQNQFSDDVRHIESLQLSVFL